MIEKIKYIEYICDICDKHLKKNYKSWGQEGEFPIFIKGKQFQSLGFMGLRFCRKVIICSNCQKKIKELINPPIAP